MSSFKDMVNANIQIETEKDLLEKDALTIASYIKNRILEVAREHKSKDIFCYEGILCTSNSCIIKMNTDKHIVKYGLFVHKSESIYSYSLTNEAKFFHKVLKKELEDDGIDISEWQIAKIRGVDELCSTGPSYLPSFEVHDKWRSYKAEMNWGPYSFDSVLKVEYNEKWTNDTTSQTTKYLYHYKNETYKVYHDSCMRACILIKFSNK